MILLSKWKDKRHAQRKYLQIKFPFQDLFPEYKNKSKSQNSAIKINKQYVGKI